METIVNGVGAPFPAEVDSENRIVVRADIIPHPQHHAAVHENMFLLDSCVTLQGTSETNILFFKNESSDIDFEFYVTHYSATGDVDIIFRFDSTRSSGGRIVTPKNSKRGSLVLIPTSRATVYDGGPSGSLALVSDGSEPWLECYLGARMPSSVDFQGALMMGNGRSVSMSAIGAAGTKVCALSMVSWHEVGSHL